MTLTRLRHLLTYWQKRLRLQEWDIHLRLASQLEIDCYGCVEASPKLGSAIITICTEESYSNPNPDQPYDPEWTLVHELLHLRFSPINTMFGKKLGEAEVQYERGIDKLALALVELRRGK